MKDIQSFISSILSKVKVANVSEDESTSVSAYKTEPILKTGREIFNSLPYKYREMRKIKLSYQESFYDYNTRLFYEQGKFMENVEDNFEYNGEFDQYFPTYQLMNDNQLRGYFSWRTKVRKDCIEKTYFSFIFIYIYELLNNIGVSSTLDGYEKLLKFWVAYNEFEPKLNHYLSIWMKDYIIYYGLDTKLLSVLKSDIAIRQLEIIYDFKNFSPKELTGALNYFSNYNLLKTKFYKQYNTDIDEIVYRVFSELTEYYDKHRKNSIFTKFFGNKTIIPYYMFSNAVFYKANKPSDHEVSISMCEKYTLLNGYWRREYYVGAKKRNKNIGEILSIVENIMQGIITSTTPIVSQTNIKIYYNIIEKIVHNYYIENEMFNLHLTVKKSAKTKVEIVPQKPIKVIIDTSKFDEIRAISNTIQNRLVIETEPVIPVLNLKDEPVIIENIILNELEIIIIKAMIENDNRKINDIIKARGLMLFVVIDDINEKLFDEFNDNCIEIYDDKPQIIHDYLDDLKGLINI